MNVFLRAHPEIFIPERKELHFFGSDLELRRPVLTLESYLSFFEGATNEKRVGESSVWYLYSKEAAREIRAFNPEASIIIMLRNPVDMLYSLHSQMLYTGNEAIEDFGASLNAEEDRRRGLRIPETARNPKGLLYREVARYAEQVERYFDTFGRERVHIIVFDDFKEDVAQVYRATCGFLGVCTDFSPNFRVINPNKRVRSRRVLRLIKSPNPRLRGAVRTLLPRPLRAHTIQWFQRANTSYEPRKLLDLKLRSRLQEELAPEIMRLGRLLGRDFSHWVKRTD